ncbi:MAG: beta-ketoacyl synthase N-terminal-like domain-containing protein, partial [Cyanobacteria bacterium P01_E01_bin.34]
MGKTTTVLPPNAIAIVGMACRFPGAPNLEQFWQNLRNGVECVTFFSDRELLDAGVDPDLLANPHYVKARAILEDIDRFDARFFELTPREAEITDPQHRLFLECAWEALERAAYEANSFSGRIGLFAGVSASSYTLNNLYLNPTFIQSVGDIQTGIRLAGLGSDKDFLTTRVSYKLNLTGPSVDVQSACSTSLVAIHLACQSLLSFQSDMVLAGGASIQVPQQAGYLHQDGGVLSPDGHCRAFDARARGTIPGSGVGVVVLKRLEEALEDGDRVLAVIRSSAMNNDGSSKVGFTAPSVEGQAETIAEALSLAEVSPKTIGYVETHGTGTALGDPIEVAALTQAFRTGTDRTGFCAIGSVKPSIGHLDAAAGVAGLIEAVLALQHRQIPPSLNFEQPNPQINFAKSPFFVADRLIDWPRQDWPRRAGVSSFGIGGTNVHAVLEEAPECEMSGSSRPWQLLLLSAKTPTALDRATRNLATCLRQEPTLNLADVAYTLQVGRKGFDYRRALMCQTVNDAVMALDPLDPQRVLTQSCEGSPRTVVFMFPGQGSQYTNMGRDLYESETLFRQEVDRCCDLLLPHLGLDLRTVLYPQEPVAAQAKSLKDTALAQPALFVLEYALAKLWMQWGIRPQALMGHSLGEIVAACIAGVFELEDALALVAQRGRLMQSCPAGAMLSVQLPEDKLQSWLTSSLTLAVRNAPDLWVVSGVPEEVDRLETQLTQAGVTCRRLHVSHGFHSPLMASVREPLLEQLRTLKLKEPQIPFLSNLTGTWITPQEATKPDYWAKLLEHPVHFTETCAEILSDPHRSYLEVGPGRTLGTLLERHTEETVGVIPSLRHPQEEGSDVAFVLSSLSRLWLSGISLDWQAFSAHESRQRLLLPTYPFERERYWIESSQPQQRAPDVDVWPSLIDAVRSQGSTGWQATLNTPEHREAQRILNQLCVAYMKEGLQEIGAFGQQNEYLSVADISQRGAIAPRYHQLMHRWVEVLASAGYVERDGERFCKSSKHSVEIQELLTQAQELCSTRPLMVERVRLCGENLATVLRGEQEPLTVFLPLSEKANQQPDPELPLYSKLKESVRSAIDSIVQSTPTKQLRILEIGAGQGSVTREVLPLLPAERTRYCFTDVGGFFLRLAEQRFSDYPFMSFQLLDIDESPQEQGFSSHNFDIAIAVNVLHVTRNLRKTLAHVKSVLASGGVLILLEITQAEPEFDLTDGLLMNPLEDEDRSYGNPFWTVDTWQEELQAQGFSAVEAIPNTSDSGHHVILARGPETSSTPSAFCLATTGAQSRELELDRLAKKTDIADW